MEAALPWTGTLRIAAHRPIDDVGATSLYWLACIWDSAGRLVWDSAPNTYSSKGQALNAAKRAKRRLFDKFLS